MLLRGLRSAAQRMAARGWSVLTLRSGVFFFALAVLNEIMGGALTWDHWVWFKCPGAMIIVFLSTFSQVPFFMRHELKGEAAESAPEHISSLQK